MPDHLSTVDQSMVQQSRKPHLQQGTTIPVETRVRKLNATQRYPARERSRTNLDRPGHADLGGTNKTKLEHQFTQLQAICVVVRD